MTLSERQREMLRFIRWFIDENQYAPTYNEIRFGMGLSTKSLVAHHLDMLERAGCIRREANKVRAIWVRDEGVREDKRTGGCHVED